MKRHNDVISFKEFLLVEEFKKLATSNKKGMWKNPTKQEYKDIPSGVRAIVDHNGNVYIADEKIRYDRDSGFSDNHHEVAILLTKLWTAMRSFTLGMDYTKAISLVRVGKTRLFKIGEDEWAGVGYATDDEDEDPNLSHPIHKKRIQLLRKANKKNPAFSFQYKPISEEDDRWTT